ASGGAILPVDLSTDEHWRATLVQRAHDSLVASVEQMRRALKLSRGTDAILEEIKQTLHTQVRGQRVAFSWIETEGSVQEAMAQLPKLFGGRRPGTGVEDLNRSASLTVLRV